MFRNTTTQQKSQVSQNLSVKENNRISTRHQRTTTSNRTGGALSSAQTSNGQRPSEKPKPKIFDESNIDVTPKALFETDSSIRTRHGSALFQSLEGSSTPTDLLSNASAFNTNPIMTTGFQSFGLFPESSSQLSTDSNQPPTDSTQESSMLDKEKEVSALFFTDVEGKKSDDQSYFNINLAETSTFCLLNIPIVCVTEEDPNFKAIKERNEKYQELCKNKLGNDSYVERSINTFNDLPKSKMTQTEKITINEKETNCTTWDMYDSYNKIDNESSSLAEKENKPGAAERNKEKNDMATTTSTAVRPDSSGTAAKGSLKSSSFGTRTGTILSDNSFQNSNIVELSNKKKSIEENFNYLENEIFKLNAFFMERLLNQNTYQMKQAKYRGLFPYSYFDDSLVASSSAASVTSSDNSSMKKSAAISKTGGGNDEALSSLAAADQNISLEKLWTYTCSLTKDRNLSCLVWNKKNTDILAVGYGKFEYNDEQNGLVCCWSLKNPEFPERFYKTEAGVTSLAFSQKHANLLAVGLFNGNILVFDVRNNNTVSLISTNESDNKHLSPVWHLKWTEKERAHSNNEEEEMEVLMSVSTDGRVTQWMIRKGFESSDYLKLKRVSNKTGGANATNASSNKKEKDKNDGFISRHSGGLSFDIWDQDKSIYLCGTEEGFIHRCSTSYNEQYLDTYSGHTGPVYKILWSPFLKNAFLSASGDWTIRLWKVDRVNPCLTFNSSTKSVFDISWSTKSATLFCCVTENAIEIWDLNKSTLDPIYSTVAMAPTKLTAVSYSPNSDSIIVGTNDGSLWVYAIKNLPKASKPSELDDIIKQSLLSQLESLKEVDSDSKDVIEQHQLDAFNQLNNNKIEEELEEGINEKTLEDQKEKFEMMEAKLNKIKNENQSIIDGKKAKEANKHEKKDSSSSSDDEEN